MSAHGWQMPASEALRIGPRFVLSDVDTAATPGYHGGKARGTRTLASRADDLEALQERLYAASRVGAGEDALLLVLQGMDSAGKGGIVRHVVGNVDPQGVALAAFKAPTDVERAHDFLWRVERRLPPPGFIGVFDRSHYEDVLIGKVRALADDAEIARRYDAINAFETRVAASGTRIVKVVLHMSAGEQKKRLMRRLERPDKHWKYAPGDVDERMLWPAYMDAYQAMLERTSSEVAPWHVVPADHKWYARLAVQELLLEALEDIDPHWPPANFDVDAEKARLAAT